MSLYERAKRINERLEKVPELTRQQDLERERAEKRLKQGTFAELELIGQFIPHKQLISNFNQEFYNNRGKVVSYHGPIYDTYENSLGRRMSYDHWESTTEVTERLVSGTYLATPGEKLSINDRFIEKPYLYLFFELNNPNGLVKAVCGVKDVAIGEKRLIRNKYYRFRVQDIASRVSHITLKTEDTDYGKYWIANTEVFNTFDDIGEFREAIYEKMAKEIQSDLM